jgi:hypothetical protein
MNNKFNLFVQSTANDSEPMIMAIFSRAFVTKIDFSLYDNLLLSAVLETLTEEGSSQHGITKNAQPN